MYRTTATLSSAAKNGQCGFAPNKNRNGPRSATILSRTTEPIIECAATDDMIAGTQYEKENEMTEKKVKITETGLSVHVANLQAEQTEHLEKMAGQIGCIMWLLLGLVFGPILLFVLGLFPWVLALLAAIGGG